MALKIIIVILQLKATIIVKLLDKVVKSSYIMFIIIKNFIYNNMGYINSRFQVNIRFLDNLYIYIYNPLYWKWLVIRIDNSKNNNFNKSLNLDKAFIFTYIIDLIIIKNHGCT